MNSVLFFTLNGLAVIRCFAVTVSKEYSNVSVKFSAHKRSEFYVYALPEGHFLNVGLCPYDAICGEAFTYSNEQHICRSQSKKPLVVKLQLLCCLFWALLVSLCSGESAVPFWLLLSFCAVFFFTFVCLSCHTPFLIFSSL